MSLLTRDQGPRFPRHYCGTVVKCLKIADNIDKSGNSPALGDKFMTFLV